MSAITPVLLSGGTGSRLWPLSREAFPKQLLPLLGQKTLLQETLQRVTDSPWFGPPVVIANAEHRFLIAEQLRDIGCSESRIIIEPFARNTCPAATVASIIAEREEPDSIVLVMPADHSIGDVAAFHEAIQIGLDAARDGAFVLFGITPTSAATGYGYIHYGESIGERAIHRVLSFKEKPDLNTAKTYLASGTYTWNSGIFLLPARRFLEAVSQLEPQLFQACSQAVDRAVTDLDFLRLNPDAFRHSPDASIDCAVMERTSNAVVVPTECAWSDIGAWSALWDIADKDDCNTAAVGDVVSVDARNCYIRSDGPLIGAVGVDDLIIVATPDATLVATKHRDQDVKQLVCELKSAGHQAATQTPRVHRPWGFYQSLHVGERFQVKRITVSPGEKLSLQKHFHRSEHWVVVNGTALVTRDSDQLLLRENESIYLPLGCVHRLENPGRIPLILIEIQSGAYLGEDDIVRLQDVYARESEDTSVRTRGRFK